MEGRCDHRRTCGATDISFTTNGQEEIRRPDHPSHKEHQPNMEHHPDAADQKVTRILVQRPDVHFHTNHSNQNENEDSANLRSSRWAEAQQRWLPRVAES